MNEAFSPPVFGQGHSTRMALLFFAFEWELLQRHGVAPEVGSCASCGNSTEDIKDSVLWFSPADGGLVCGGCVRLGDAAGGKPMGPEALACLRRLSGTGLRTPMDQHMERGLRRQIGAHLHRFLGYHMPGYRLPSALDLLRAGKESNR